jgi:protein-tyrosine phosphatase
LKKRIAAVLSDVAWRLKGPRYRQPLAGGPVRSLLFLCKGNICRSPYAERAAAKIFSTAGVAGVEFASAGIDVRTPSPSPENAVAVARTMGVDLDAHRSRQVTAAMLDAFGAIFVMEAWQFDHLRKRFPDCRAKLFLLPLFDPEPRREAGARGRYNIPDPYGQGREAFAACFRSIDRCLAAVLEATASRSGRQTASESQP